MRKKVLVVDDRGEVSLHGSTHQGRFTDEQLAQVANMPEIRKVSSLGRQPITKLPPFVAVEELKIGVLPELESLAGLERMTTLRSLTFEQIDLYPDAMERMRELPELVELTIIGGRLTRLPNGIAKLPSLLKLTLHVRKAGFDFVDACKQIAASKTIRHVEIWAIGLAIPDVLAPLSKLESIELFCKTAPPSLWSLANLRSLILLSRDKRVDVGKLTNLRSLTIKAKITALPGIESLRELRTLRLAEEFRGELPAHIVEQVVELEGPARYAKQPHIPEDEEQHYNHELPPSFGPVRDLHLYGNLRAPLSQLAECTQLETLEFTGNSGVEYLLPLLPPQLRSLRLAFRAKLPALPPMPKLFELEIIAGKTASIDLSGFASLRRLTVRCDGARLTGLDQTKLEALTLERCAMPKLDELAVKKLDVIGMAKLDIGKLASLPSLVELRVARTAKIDRAVFPTSTWTTSKVLAGKMLTRS